MKNKYNGKSVQKTEEKVLDEKEMAFLKGLRPLRVIGIIKHARPDKGTEFLELHCAEVWDPKHDAGPASIVSMQLPDFLAGSMYKGLQCGVEYFTVNLGIVK